MKVFYDCEFLEDGRTVAPLSLAMVSERSDVADLYLIFNAPGTITRATSRPWLVDNVLSTLPVTLPYPNVSSEWSWDTSHPDWSRVVSRVEAQERVKAFVQAHGPDVELWGDYVAYDHVLLAQLYGRMIDLPEGFPMFSHDLQQMISDLRSHGMDVRDLPSLPEAGNLEHNALHDAREVRMRWQFLRDVAQLRDWR